MKHATYIGPDTGWNVEAGMGAMVQPHPTDPTLIRAQFDAFHAQRAGVDLAFGWHDFPVATFKIDEAIDWTTDTLTPLQNP